jgi:hypothetical protein
VRTKQEKDEDSLVTKSLLPVAGRLACCLLSVTDPSQLEIPRIDTSLPTVHTLCSNGCHILLLCFNRMHGSFYHEDAMFRCKLTDNIIHLQVASFAKDLKTYWPTLSCTNTDDGFHSNEWGKVLSTLTTALIAASRSTC